MKYLNLVLPLLALLGCAERDTTSEEAQSQADIFQMAYSYQHDQRIYMPDIYAFPTLYRGNHFQHYYYPKTRLGLSGIRHDIYPEQQYVNNYEELKTAFAAKRNLRLTLLNDIVIAEPLEVFAYILIDSENGSRLIYESEGKLLLSDSPTLASRHCYIGNNFSSYPNSSLRFEVEQHNPRLSYKTAGHIAIAGTVNGTIELDEATSEMIYFYVGPPAYNRNYYVQLNTPFSGKIIIEDSHVYFDGEPAYTTPLLGGWLASYSANQQYVLPCRDFRNFEDHEPENRKVIIQWCQNEVPNTNDLISCGE